MKNKKNTKIILLNILCGTIVGFVNGFFGGGGGMICVPFLEMFLKTENKKAHATTLCIILPLSIVSSLIYIYYSAIDFYMLLSISISSCAFALVGCIFLQKFSSNAVKIIFACIMLAAGIKMVIL